LSELRSFFPNKKNDEHPQQEFVGAKIIYDGLCSKIKKMLELTFGYRKK
jgi:hypothetical protein